MSNAHCKRKVTLSNASLWENRIRGQSEGVVDRIFQGGLGGLFIILGLLIYFPGGTIIMALACNSRRLDGWDWVLSVIIPAYGLMKALFGSYCR